MSATEVLAAAKALPLDERIELARSLWEDITRNGYDPDLTPEQAVELDRRLADFEKHPQDGIPWAEVEADLNRLVDMSAAQVLAQIDKLPFAEQREVFEQLCVKFDESDDHLTPEQVAELDRRAEDALQNPGRGIPWEKLRDEMLREYKK